MKRPRIFRMTVSNIWYNPDAGTPVGVEIHYRIPRRGTIRSVRRQMAKRILPHFQQYVYRVTGHWPRKRYIRMAFEHEEPTRKTEQDIQVVIRKMERQRKKWKGYPLPSRVLRFIKRKRKRKK